MARARQDFDEAVGPGEDTLSVVKAINGFKDEAEQARRSRISRNKQNRDIYLGRQDFTHKVKGQSREFLPKTAIAVEQMTSFVKRGLIQFGNWFSVHPSKNLQEAISGSDIVELMQAFMANLCVDNNKRAHIATVVSDSVKVGLLESLMILKVHGRMVPKRSFAAGYVPSEVAEDGSFERKMTLNVTEDEEWLLKIDMIRAEDYYPDPTGRGLYEIQETEYDLHDIIELAEQGLYDMAAVRQLIDTDFPRPEDNLNKRTEEAADQDQTTAPSFRKRVVLTEFWGTLLNQDGTVAHRNCVATIANKKYLIRPPEPNPFWHQMSPFIAVPLVRVPWSVWHKALYDHASQLNIAINEIFNLILDGGIAAVWGIRQVRTDYLEDPGEVSDGIPQGKTLAVKSDLPIGAKVVESLTESEVPQSAMAIFEACDREFNSASLTNELKLGALPAKQVRATEIVEASQSQAVTLDGLIADLENDFMVALLTKVWYTILQNADDIPPGAELSDTAERVARLIMMAPPEERFALFANNLTFKAFGLSGTMAKARDFQRIMAMLQAVSTNPALMQAFMKKFSPDKALLALMRALNLNPNHMQKDAEELKNAGQEMADTMGMAQMMQGLRGESGGQKGMGGSDAGSPGLQGEVNQQMNPITGTPQNA